MSLLQRCLCSGSMVVAVPLLLFAAPPYMWYATFSIENYDGNGDCGKPNLQYCHDEADGFSAAVQSKNVQNASYQFNRRDTECTAARWSGRGAEINFVDFLFFAGHGCGKGPVLGCNPGYPITCWNDIRFGGYGYLKWVMSTSCLWFSEIEWDDCNANLEVLDRWGPCFKGVHCVLAHRATTWDSPYSDEMTMEFWKQWIDYSMPIFWAWGQSQIRWVYNKGYPGLCPAVVAHNQGYANERYSQATDNPAPDGADWFEYLTVGNPLY